MRPCLMWNQERAAYVLFSVRNIIRPAAFISPIHINQLCSEWPRVKWNNDRPLIAIHRANTTEVTDRPLPVVSVGYAPWPKRAGDRTQPSSLRSPNPLGRGRRSVHSLSPEGYIYSTGNEAAVHKYKMFYKYLQIFYTFFWMQCKITRIYLMWIFIILNILFY